MSSLFYVTDILLGQYSSFFAAHGNLFNASIICTAEMRNISQKAQYSSITHSVLLFLQQREALCFCVQPRLNGDLSYLQRAMKLLYCTVQPWLNAECGSSEG